LTASGFFQYPGSWSPDGRFLAYSQCGEGLSKTPHGAADCDIWVLRAEDSEARAFLATEFDEGYPEFSPDGEWLALASNESGRPEVYVARFQGLGDPGRKTMVSTGGGDSPVWARSGRELFYRGLSGDRLMKVDVTTGESFTAGAPRVLFENPDIMYYAWPSRNFDVTPDGHRFVMIERVDPEPKEVTRIHVVLNWSEELKRLVPTE